MSTLTDIQRLVNTARSKSAWTEIEIAIGQCTDLDFKYRKTFAERLHKQLDDRYLEGNLSPEPIDVMKILNDIKANWPPEESNGTGSGRPRPPWPPR